MGSLFGSKSAPTPAPVQVPIIPEPTVMPMASDESTKKAKVLSLLQQKRRSGRTSTILTTDDKLGA